MRRQLDYVRVVTQMQPNGIDTATFNDSSCQICRVIKTPLYDGACLSCVPPEQQELITNFLMANKDITQSGNGYNTIHIVQWYHPEDGNDYKEVVDTNVSPSRVKAMAKHWTANRRLILKEGKRVYVEPLLIAHRGYEFTPKEYMKRMEANDLPWQRNKMDNSLRGMLGK